MSKEDIAHRVVRPLLFLRFTNGRELLLMPLVRSAIGQGLSTDPLPRQIHRDRRVTAFRPQLNPRRKGLPTTAMHEHERWVFS